LEGQEIGFELAREEIWKAPYEALFPIIRPNISPRAGWERARNKLLAAIVSEG
jgi:hypothetical protein